MTRFATVVDVCEDARVKTNAGVFLIETTTVPLNAVRGVITKFPTPVARISMFVLAAIPEVVTPPNATVMLPALTPVMVKLSVYC